MHRTLELIVPAAADNFDEVIDHLTSRAESERIVDNWITTAKGARVKLEQGKVKDEATARQAGDKAAEGLVKAALLAALGLGLGTAAFGGRRAVPHAVAVAGTPVA